MTHFRFRPTSNQRAIMIEDLVAQRQRLHVETVKNLRAGRKDPRSAAMFQIVISECSFVATHSRSSVFSELKGGKHPAPQAVLALFDRHLNCIHETPPTVFNEDDVYKVVVAASMDLKRALEAVSAAYSACYQHLVDESGQMDEKGKSRLLVYLTKAISAVRPVFPLLSSDGLPDVAGITAALGTVDGLSSRRRDCHSAAPPSTVVRCFNRDGERASAK